MAMRSLSLILPVFATLGIACGADRIVQPDPVVLGRIELTPPGAALYLSVPHNTVQLVLNAFDQAGAPARGAGDTTYVSSAPAIARVNGVGVVTAVTPGTARITASFTLRGITRTATVPVTVYPIEVGDVYGVYDLVARITAFDSAWGDLTGYGYTAVLTLGEVLDPPWLLKGRYSDLRLTGPNDGGVVADTGSVDSYFSVVDGRFILRLVGNQQRIGLDLLPASTAPGSIEGQFFCCGHIGGTFTATRRE